MLNLPASMSSLSSMASSVPSNTAGLNPSSGLATDATSTNALRASAARDPKSAIKEAAKQFEALFMNELMKSMRQASISSGMLDNAGTQMGTEMLDAQFATKMTGLPGGLSEMIARQLDRQTGGPTKANATGTAASLAASALAPASAAGAATPSTATTPATPTTRQSEFVRQHTQAARAAEAETGIPASFMVAQAAHESGWGKREIKNADGSSSFNVFGIKAGSQWDGPTTTVTTTEYVNGEARKTQAKFRAYGSYEEAFRDYASMMKDSPRYAKVVAKADTAQGFAKGLQRAGYATDPAYADKLTRVINTTLRLQRVMT